MAFLAELFIFLVAALAVVPVMNRLGLSSVIGYLVAGVLIGPSGFALFSNANDVLHFSEIGIVLLLFVIGLELQPKRLWVMRHAVFGLGTLQVLLTTLVLALAISLLGVALVPAVLIGFSLALSSTAFVLQLLAEKKQLTHPHGRAAFGVLLFQDMAVIPVIAYLSFLSGSSGMDPVVIGMVLVGLVAARFLLRPVLRVIANTGIHELFIAASLAIVTGAALAMHTAGLSMGLGAFIAGMLVADSEYRHQLETDVMPFKGLLLGLFFIAVGMSANLNLLVEMPLIIIALTVALVALKVLVIYPIAVWHKIEGLGRLKTAVILSQGGEFAFVLLTVAVGGELIEAAYMEMAVLVVTLSMASTPFLMMLVEKVGTAKKTDLQYDSIEHDAGEIIIAGFGRVGQIIGRVLSMKGIPFTALDSNPGQIEFVRSYGNVVYYGDATRLDLLENAGVKNAKAVVIAVNDVEACSKLAAMLRHTYPEVLIFARARHRHDEIRLRNIGVHFVVRDTFHSSLSLAESLMSQLGYADAERSVDTFQQHDEATIRKQAAFIDDEQAFRKSSIDAAQELRQLFADDKSDP